MFAGARSQLQRGIRGQLIAVFTAILLFLPGGTALSAGPDDRPYDGKLLRLSEILGAVHYLRELCGADEGQIWRTQMKELVKSEGTSALRRVKLVKRFNKGYRGYRRTYRSCTQSAKLSINRFMSEGARISERLVEQNK